MPIQSLPSKIEQVLKADQSAVIETGAVTTSQILELAKLIGTGRTLTIRSAYTITEEHLVEIARMSKPGSIIFDFTR